MEKKSIGLYPLSLNQSQLWYLEKLYPGTRINIVRTVLKIYGNLEITIFEQVLQEIVNRHESLRAKIVDIDSTGYQIFQKKLRIHLEFEDLSNYLSKDQKKKLDEILLKEAFTVFNLSKPPLFRFKLFKLDINSYFFLITIHHLIIDAWSIDLIAHEIGKLYEAFSCNIPVNLPNIEYRYTDYIELQKKVFLGASLEKKLEYWQKMLDSAPPILRLPTLFYPSNHRKEECNSYIFFISNKLLRSLKNISNENNATLFVTISSALFILFSRYSLGKDIVLGMPFANRGKKIFQDIAGFFVNTLPIRVDIEGCNTFIEVINKVRSRILGALLNQEMPFVQLVEAINPERSNFHNPLFQIMINHVALSKPNFKSEKLLVERVFIPNAASVFDLIISIVETQNSCQIYFDYPIHLLEYSKMSQMASHLTELLSNICINQTWSPEEYPLLTSREMSFLLKNNSNEKCPLKIQSISEVFEQQVNNFPGNIAIIHEGIQLSYDELNQRSNQLAYYLKQNYPIHEEATVALCIDKSQYVPISLLAILKAGAAYVPIDPNYPAERIAYILKDTQARIILTNLDNFKKLTNLNKLLVNQKIDVLSVDEPSLLAEVFNYPKDNLAVCATGDNLAYVIYTSGTTGKPKGVIIEQKGVVSLVKNVDYINIKPSDSFIQISNIAFDAATFEIWGALLNGSKLYIPNEKNKSFSHLDSLQKLLKKNKISILFLTKSLFDQFFLLNPKLFKGVKWFFVGGESLNKELILQLVKSNYSPRNVFNVYGPTENTSFSTIFKVNRDNIEKLESVPIGKSIANRKAYILDSKLMLLPAGIIGELYVGGIGLCREYLNQSKLSAEKFVVNPFQTEIEKKEGLNSRLYKTGDLAHLLSDGNIAYMGRIDSQVKIRGFRIELREIEQVLLAHEKIKHAVVVQKKLKESKTDDLVGYYTLNKPIENEELIRYLSSILPEYMIPKVLIPLKEIPLTSSGKLDIRALPDPTVLASNHHISHIRPRNILESQVLTAMAEILNLNAEQIGIYDDFFRFGGNSISVIKLVNRLSKILRKNINISLVFEARTPEKLSHYLLTQSKKEILIPRFSVNLQEQLVSFAQERLLFIEEYERGTNVYNISMVFNIDPSIQIGILEKSVKKVIERHDTLRTIIKKNKDGANFLFIIDHEKLDANIINQLCIKRDEFELSINKVRSYIFDLYIEIPIKVTLINIIDSKEEKETYLSIVIHHIAFDGWSKDILLNELKSHYDYFLNQSVGITTKLNLPLLPIQYKDFSLWQRKYLTKKRLEKLLHYWKNNLFNAETLNLLTDYPRPVILEYNGDEVHFKIESSLLSKIQVLMNKLNVSLNTILLSSYILLLRIYSGQEDIIVGTLIADRQYPQIANLIGFFVNTLPIRVKCFSQIVLATFIKEVDKEISEANSHKELPFEKLVSELEFNSDTSRHPIFQALFTLHSFKSNHINKFLDPLATSSFFNTAKFDLTLLIDDSEADVKGCLNFSTSLFKRRTIEEYVETYLVILKQFQIILTNPSFSIEDLHYLSKKRQQQICYAWNAADQLFPYNLTISQIFEKQTEKTPNNIALQYENVSFTYSDINKKINQLSHYIRMLYFIQPDSLIALFLERNEKVLISILAVLKAGAAYVPIDIDYPDERIAYLLRDADIQLVLTNAKFAERLNSLKEAFSIHSLKIVPLECIEEQILSQSFTNPKTEISSCNLAYVIYTSGTTGNPKGVMIEHSSYIAAVIGIRKKYFSTVKEIATYSMTNYVFDIFGLEFGLPLLTGGKIVLGNKDFKKLNCRYFDFIQMTPSLCKLVLDRFIYPHETKFLIGGEILDLNLLDELSKKDCQIINVYGPTETTIWSTAKFYMKNKKYAFKYSNIGKALPNEKVYVLDKQLKLLPIGAPGELYIGGKGVARGYLNQSKLTLDKFINNPFQSKREKKENLNPRLYKTGDIVRWLLGGELEYIGRNDHQVKIFGYRIELQEIEKAISSYEEVKWCTVLAKSLSKSTNTISLLCYYLAKSPISEEKFINFLQAKLPKHMVPKIYVHLDQFPMTINGKLNKKVLPVPKLGDTSVMILPRNNLDRQILIEWAKTLGISEKKISIRQDFFKLGGNSFLAIKMIDKLKNELHLNLNIKDIFIYSTVEALSDYIMSNNVLETNQKVDLKNQIVTHIINQLSKDNLNHDDITDFNDLELFLVLNEKTVFPPLFLFPPSNGGIESYLNNIATFLPDRQLVLFENFYHYILKKFGLIKANCFSIEKLAQIYIILIKSVSPKGPYNLFGWSFGGILALEVAKQLSNKNEEVKNIFLIDPLFNLKDTVSKIDSTYIESDDINFKYVPSFSNKIGKPNIVLFKATKIMKAEFIFSTNTTWPNDIQRKIFNYYVEKTKYNEMDIFLNQSYFQTVPLLHHHFSWIEDKIEINKICMTIKNLMLLD